MRTTILFLSFQFLTLLGAAAIHVGAGKSYPTVCSIRPYVLASQKAHILELTAAYNAAVPGDILFVFPGTYNEQIVIAKDNITFQGSSCPSLNPSENNVTITHVVTASDGGNDASGSHFSSLLIQLQLTPHSNAFRHSVQFQIIQHKRGKHRGGKQPRCRNFLNRLQLRFLHLQFQELAEHSVYA